MARLKDRYREEIVPTLMQELGYQNVMQVPKLQKNRRQRWARRGGPERTGDRRRGWRSHGDHGPATRRDAREAVDCRLQAPGRECRSGRW